MFKRFNKVAVAAVASAVALSFAAPAQAAITICSSPGCVQPDSNVLFSGSTTGNPIFAGLNDDPAAVVRFNGTESLNGTQSGGQARISAGDGTLNFLSILLQPSTLAYNEIEFNLNSIGTGTALLEFFSTTGVLLGSGSFAISGGGQNFFGAFDAAIGRTDITITGTSLTDVRQIRLTAGNITTAVPEPGTWALMLFGFGAVGYSMRRRRRSSAMLQIA